MPTKRKPPRASSRSRNAGATTRQAIAPVTVEGGPTLDLSRARALFTESLNRVNYRGERIVIKRHGRPVAALVPVEDLDLIREIEDRIDLQDARKALAEAKGKFIPWETVKRELGL
jgi:prevent-host-death family protein